MRCTGCTRPSPFQRYNNVIRGRRVVSWGFGRVRLGFSRARLVSRGLGRMRLGCKRGAKGWIGCRGGEPYIHEQIQNGGRMHNLNGVGKLLVDLRM